MRSITIVGAGLSGLLLGIGLLKHGYDVTIVSDRTPEQIRNGFLPSSAGISPDAQDFERELDLAFWDSVVSPTTGVQFDVLMPDGHLLLAVGGPWNPQRKNWQAVDLRLKCGRWSQEFQKRGGRFVVKPAELADLEAYSAASDLTIVAAGKGEIARLFERDAERSVLTEAQRRLAMVVMDGHRGWAEMAGFDCLYFESHAGVGEIFGSHFLNTTERDAIFLTFEGVPGGPIDRFGDVSSPEEALARAKEVLMEVSPRQYELARDAVLADPRGAIWGSITPVVRRPVGTLPSGAHLLGIGDVLSLKDPIAGQGANSAVKGARHYLHRILERGGESFDPEWMADVWETFWMKYERYAYEFSRSLMEPPSDFRLELMVAATKSDGLAAKMFGNFSDPPNAFPWFFDADEAARVLNSPEAPLAVG